MSDRPYPDLLDLLEREPAVLPRLEAEIVEDAIRACAKDHAEFGVKDVRAYYARTPKACVVGYTFSRLKRDGVIVAIDVDRSGNGAARNAMKLVNLYRLGNQGEK